jgi:hypothetical protein
MVKTYKNIQLDIIVEVEPGLSVDDFNDKFLDWVVSNGWKCGGSMWEVDDNGKSIIKK